MACFFEEKVSLLIYIVAGVVLIHVATAIIGSIILSSIPRRIYKEKLLVVSMCWLIPLFGVLLVAKEGKHVPKFGQITYRTAREKAAAKFQEEIDQKEIARSINERDSKNMVARPVVMMEEMAAGLR